MVVHGIYPLDIALHLLLTVFFAKMIYSSLTDNLVCLQLLGTWLHSFSLLILASSYKKTPIWFCVMHGPYLIHWKPPHIICSKKSWEHRSSNTIICPSLPSSPPSKHLSSPFVLDFPESEIILMYLPYWTYQ